MTEPKSNPPEAGGGPRIPLPPGFPEGVDPTTYKRDVVEHLLRRSAYINAFSISIPDRPDVPIPPPGSSDPEALIGIRVYEQPHRFDVRLSIPSCGESLTASNVVSQPHAFLTLRWTLIPEDFYALPTSEPPPTLLDPTRSQRFTMLDGVFVFDDAGNNRFHGFGAGRTYPVVVGGRPRLRLGAVGNIMQGWGIFEGVQGSYVINGYITPPHGLYLQMLFRILDPEGRFLTEGELAPVKPIPDPNPESTYMTFLGEADPENPIQQHFGPDGNLTGATVHELLRTVELGFDRGRSGQGLRTKTTVGPIVAKLRTVLDFNPFDPATPGTALSPVPWQTTSTEISFFDDSGTTIGTIQANVTEGRGFSMELPGAPGPAFRLVGFGQLLGGTGEFEGADGLLSVNAAISPFPAALSNLYVIRLVDVAQKFRTRR